MPQSLSRVIVHIIFSTKNREPWLESDVRPRMHAYLATVCRDLGAELVCVGGVADHVHILTTLPRTVSQAQLIEEIKKASSKWIKTLDPRYRGFFWQRGYSAFSVSPSQLDTVVQYVKAQQEHHRTRTFQEEYRELLSRHGVDLMSGTFGIEATPETETRFQRLVILWIFGFLGRCPRLI
ncbi:MAG: IS200/IS605 family transposase [Candidatus Udaeobacter sp.]